MGERNNVTKEYMKQNDRFADLCNYYLFQGEQVIRPEDLVEKDPVELALPYKGNKQHGMENIRDLLKNAVIRQLGDTLILIIGIEGQTDIHYAMPVRDMLYDAVRYADQVKAIAKERRQEKQLHTSAEYLSGLTKKDRLSPVITITVYWNSGTWDGARSLHELLNTSDPDILKFVSDYRLNLIVPDEITDFDKFHTELGRLMEFFHCADSKDKMKQLIERERERNLLMSRDAVDVLNTCLNTGIEPPEKEEDVNMCKGLDDLMAEEREAGRAEGEARGMAQGVAQGMAAMITSLKKYITDTDDLYRAVTENEVYKDITKEEFLKFV